MNSQLPRVITHSLKTMLCAVPKANFGLDKTLKDRDEGQEKVYINQMESIILIKGRGYLEEIVKQTGRPRRERGGERTGIFQKDEADLKSSSHRQCCFCGRS